MSDTTIFLIAVVASGVIGFALGCFVTLIIRDAPLLPSGHDEGDDDDDLSDIWGDDDGNDPDGVEDADAEELNETATRRWRR